MVQYVTVRVKVDADSPDAAAVRVKEAIEEVAYWLKEPVIVRVSQTYCGHPEWRDGACAEMVCPNYINKKGIKS